MGRPGQSGLSRTSELEQFEVNFCILWQVVMNKTNWLSTSKCLFVGNIGVPDRDLASVLGVTLLGVALFGLGFMRWRCARSGIAPSTRP